MVVGVNFTVTARECNRVADTPPTGTISFKDKTTHHSLGSAATAPDPSFVNCSDASVMDTETLGVGSYKIKASYHPGGATPAAASHGKYTQKVIEPPFTKISWTTGAAVPNAHEEGAAVADGGLVYDISGSTGDCSDGGCGTMQPAVDIYNPLTNAFSSAAAIPHPRTEDPAAVVVNGDIYVLSGAVNGVNVERDRRVHSRDRLVDASGGEQPAEQLRWRVRLRGGDGFGHLLLRSRDARGRYPQHGHEPAQLDRELAVHAAQPDRVLQRGDRRLQHRRRRSW